MRETGVRVGTAAWAIPAKDRARFGEGASVLERYATALNAVEINSSFYRPHRPATYRRWAELVPDDFRFSVKLPKAITHERRLIGCDDELDLFASASAELGAKRAVVLVQLPPTLKFDADVAGAFFGRLTHRVDAAIACEPRHASWFDGAADDLLAKRRVARVAADPARYAGAGSPGGWIGLRYYRMHGSPRTYYSRYDDAALKALAQDLRAGSDERWCIFDNTAASHAAGDALDLAALVGEP